MIKEVGTILHNALIEKSGNDTSVCLFYRYLQCHVAFHYHVVTINVLMTTEYWVVNISRNTGFVFTKSNTAGFVFTKSNTACWRDHCITKHYNHTLLLYDFLRSTIYCVRRYLFQSVLALQFISFYLQLSQLFIRDMYKSSNVSHKQHHINKTYIYTNTSKFWDLYNIQSTF